MGVISDDIRSLGEANEEEFILNVRGNGDIDEFLGNWNKWVCVVKTEGGGVDHVEIGDSVVENMLEDSLIVTVFHTNYILGNFD